MAKAYRIPDYKKMYPEAKEEVISLLRTTERKMQYQKYDFKTEQTIINQEDQTITTISSSIDTLAVQLDKAKRCGGHAKTTCRVKSVKKITSKVQSGKCPSLGGLWRAVCHDMDSL